MVTMISVLGPHTRAFLCRVCDTDFAWHPGVSGLDWPSECPNCGCKHDDDQLVEMGPAMAFARGYTRRDTQ